MDTKYFFTKYAQADMNSVVFENKEKGYFITQKKCDEEDSDAYFFDGQKFTRDFSREQLFVIYQRSDEHPEGKMLGINYSLRKERPFMDVKNGVFNMDTGFAGVYQLRDGEPVRVAWGKAVEKLSPDCIVIDDNDSKMIFDVNKREVVVDDLKDATNIGGGVVQYIKDNEAVVAMLEQGKMKVLETCDASICKDLYYYFLDKKLYRHLSDNLYVKVKTDRKNEIVSITKEGIEKISENLSNIKKSEVLKNIEAFYNNSNYSKGVNEFLFRDLEKNPDKIEAYSKLIEKYGQSREEREAIIELINKAEDQKYSEIKVGKADLNRLKGMSSADFDGRLLLDAIDVSKLSTLVEVNVDHKGSPAAELITEKFKENYDAQLVDSLVLHADEIVKLPYKNKFFRTVSYDNSSKEGFLGAYQKNLVNLAEKKYGENSPWYSIANKLLGPKFEKDADAIWNNMMKQPERYFGSDYICDKFMYSVFSDKVDELQKYIEKNDSVESKVIRSIEYLQKVGKMQHIISDYCRDNSCYLNGNLHFDLVNAGVESRKDAKHCLDIWNTINERPFKYGSSYNEYSIAQIAKIAKTEVMQDWMYPVMIKAVQSGSLNTYSERLPSERSLFDCCKAWKICPEMPQRLAEKVGRHSLYGRMLAGAVFEQMSKQGKTEPEEWKENKALHEKFFEELSRAEKMDRAKALKQYVPNTVVNRKRLVGAALEEGGVENTPDNFRALYQKMRNEGVFDKMLAKPKEAKTTFNSRLLVETARRKHSKGK